MSLSGRQRDLLKRYGLAVALAVLALGIRGALPAPHRHNDLSASAGGCDSGGLVRRPRSRVCRLADLLSRDLRTGTSCSWVSFQVLPEYRLGLLLFVFLGLVLTEFSGAPAARRASAPREQRNGSAPSCSSPSTCTGRATRSIASPGRSSPSGSPTRRRVNPKSAKRAGRFRMSNRTKTPGASTARRSMRTSRSGISSLRAPPPTAAGAMYRFQGFPCSTQRGAFAGYRGVGRHITERKLCGGRTPRTPVVPGIVGPHQPRYPGK